MDKRTCATRNYNTEPTKTEDQCADMLTKALHAPQLCILRSKIMVETIDEASEMSVGGSINNI